MMMTDEHGGIRPADPLREKASACLRLARWLRADLRGLDWAGMGAADRDGLRAALTELGGDIPLVWLIGGQSLDHECPDESESRAESRGTADTRGTAKAAPAASPSRRGIESSDGDAAFPGHPAPDGGGSSPGPNGPMRRQSVAPTLAPGNGRCAGAAFRRELCQMK